ncbi:MAG: hypothetical protein H7Y30_04915 [Pyrinomonadaceae bacterium]|nr:hypothetical protein [Pyrinomonadaceae bacterium]
MRFEVVAAFVIGILLPLLETCRRGIGMWSVDFTTMFEDYVAGALLLIGGWASVKARPWGALFLELAWAYVTGMMGGSFWYQLEDTFRSAAQEPHNLLVVIVKFLLWSACVVSLILSFRRALHARSS